jgi:hypothetical protein
VNASSLFVLLLIVLKVGRDPGLAEVESYQTLISFDKFLIRKKGMKVWILECLYQMTCESRLLYGAEVCGLDGEWKVTDRVHGRCCKKVLKYLNVPRIVSLNWSG